MDGYPLKQRFVLDTSLFITENIREEDEELEDSIDRLLGLISNAKLGLNISCYMPPSTHRELMEILEDRDVSDEVISNINTWIIRKNPARYEVMVPSEVVYNFISEIRQKMDKGLRVSEKAVRKAEKSKSETVEGHEHKTEVDEVISDLRDEYRKALRQGVLDSREDLDLLILARELDAGVVTEDSGVINSAEDFGLRYMRARDFPSLIEEYLAAAEDIE